MQDIKNLNIDGQSLCADLWPEKVVRPKHRVIDEALREDEGCCGECVQSEQGTHTTRYKPEEVDKKRR